MEPARDAFYQPPHRTMIPYPPPVSQYPPFMPHSYAATASHFGQAHLGQPSATLNASYAFPSFGGVGLPFPEQLAPGLYFMTSLCSRLYPNQLNPMQATALTKFWLGGPDPLDYISMYENPGDPKQQIPPHWHYISFGLSDLYGDGRVHEPHGPDTPSGFGFELTFRLKREPNETSPPAWPSTVMQSLAKYVFQTENVLCPGDHVSWHCSLDNSESRIQHMLMTDDPQLGTIHGPFGQITFIQIVGVTVEELQAAQQWNGSGRVESFCFCFTFSFSIFN